MKKSFKTFAKKQQVKNLPQNGGLSRKNVFRFICSGQIQKRKNMCQKLCILFEVLEFQLVQQQNHPAEVMSGFFVLDNTNE